MSDSTQNSVIQTWSHDQHKILASIATLHCGGQFECDATYGRGSFYRTSADEPRLKFDCDPQHSDVVRADAGLLPIERGVVASLVIDPPFLTYVRGGRAHKGGKVAMSERFGGYYTYAELEDSYRDMISEAYRVLKKKGVLVFKCQDIVHNHKLHATHNRVINMAELEGFRLLDLFVLCAKHRMPGPQKGKQRHARVFHSYFLVFKR